MSSRLAILLITMLSCVGCDQLTKSMARTELVPGQQITFLHDMLRLEYVENPGAFLSLGDSLSVGSRRALFTLGGSILVGLALSWALMSQRLRLPGVIGAALICAGGIGNLIDRFVRNGNVTDFLNVGIGSLRTGIFNIADFVLMLGLVLALHDGITDRH